MSAVRELDLAQVNARWGRDAPALVEWAVGLGQPTIVTTNFRPFEAVILHLVTRANPQVPVVWMDNGYNTEATYRFADEVTKQLGLNLKIYLPRRSRAHREAVEGATPALHDPRHAAFTAEVKLEPFARALRETAPQVWFTALRATDTAVRAQMDPVSINPDGLIKVAPLPGPESAAARPALRAHGPGRRCLRWSAKNRRGRTAARPGSAPAA